MTLQMVVYTEIIYAAVIIILELPTGILADKWSRKNMLVLGAILGCFELLIIVLAHSFWQFAAAIFIAGIANAFESGSEYALIYDSLKSEAREQEFEKILGRLLAFDFSAAIIAALSGSFMASRLGFGFNYRLSIASAFIAFIVTLFLSEPKIHTATGAKIKFSRYIKESFLFFRKSPQVLLVIISGTLIAACVVYVDEFWQIYLDNLLIPVVFFGAFASMTALARIPGSLLSFKLKSRFGYKKIFIFLFGAVTLSLSVMAFIKGAAGIAAIIVICAVEGLIEPLVSGYLHVRISSQMRATMDSFQSLIQRIATMAIGLGFGWVAAKISLFAAYGLIAALCTVYLVVFIAAAGKVEL